MGACCINTPKCQEEKSVMVLLFLSEENEKAVKEQFKEEFEISFDKLMIFSNFYQNQHRLFITNGRLLSSDEDCYLYLESCSLEGNLRQVVIIVDLESYKKEFSNFSYVKLLQSNSQLTDQTSLFLLNNSEQKLSKNDLELLNQFGYEQHIIKSIKIKDQFYQTLGSPTCASKKLIYDIPPIKNCEDCVKMSLQYINERKQKINMFASMKEIDYCCDMLIDFRNQVIYKCSKCNGNNAKMLNHRNALYFKFNIKLLQLLHEFTECIFKKIETLCSKFYSNILCCNNCQTISFKSLKVKSKFFNKSQNCCKNNSCSPRQNPQEYLIRYKQQFEFFTIHTIIKKLQKNQAIQKYYETEQEQSLQEREVKREDKQAKDIVNIKQEQKNSNSNTNFQNFQQIPDNQDKHIILIGKSGVGKTYIFKKLSQNEEFYCQNQETHDIQFSKSENNAFTVIDTPPFELLDEKQMLDSQKIEFFGNILASYKLCQIFIVTNYDRIENMKSKIMDCFKILNKFETKISIIILNLQNTIEVKQQLEEMKELENYFNLKCLYFNPKDQASIFIEQITKTINSSIDEYLDLDNTKFDKKKDQLTQFQFGEKLQSIKYQQQISKAEEQIKFITKQKEEKANCQKKIKQYKKDLESDKQRLLNQLQSIFLKFERLAEYQNEIQKQEYKIDQEQNELEMKKIRLEKQVIELKCKKY